MAPSTYYANKARPSSARACRDAVIGPALRELWEDNYRVYGAGKLWKAARRAATTSDVIGSPGTCGPPASPELAAANGSAPQNPIPPPRGIPIWWAGISRLWRPISSG